MFVVTIPMPERFREEAEAVADEMITDAKSEYGSDYELPEWQKNELIYDRLFLMVEQLVQETCSISTVDEEGDFDIIDHIHNIKIQFTHNQHAVLFKMACMA